MPVQASQLLFVMLLKETHFKNSVKYPCGHTVPNLPWCSVAGEHCRLILPFTVLKNEKLCTKAFIVEQHDLPKTHTRITYTKVF